MLAAGLGNLKIVELLLEKGADKSLKNEKRDNKTALDYAQEFVNMPDNEPNQPGDRKRTVEALQSGGYRKSRKSRKSKSKSRKSRRR